MYLCPINNINRKKIINVLIFNIYFSSLFRSSRDGDEGSEGNSRERGRDGRQRNPPERRESGRFPSAARLLRSLGRNRDDDSDSRVNHDSSVLKTPSGTDNDPIDPNLSRSNPHYHSEGKGLRKKNNWTSERELQTNNLQKERSHSFCEKTEAKRRYSYHENKVLRDEARARIDSATNDNVRIIENNGIISAKTLSNSNSPSPSRQSNYANNIINNNPPTENLYENVGAKRTTNPTTNNSNNSDNSNIEINSVNIEQNNESSSREESPESAENLERDRERRSVRKLTKDSGYETSQYSEGDYANIDLYSDSLHNQDQLNTPLDPHSSLSDQPQPPATSSHSSCVTPVNGPDNER